MPEAATRHELLERAGLDPARYPNPSPNPNPNPNPSPSPSPNSGPNPYPNPYPYSNPNQVRLDGDRWPGGGGAADVDAHHARAR